MIQKETIEGLKKYIKEKKLKKRSIFEYNYNDKKSYYSNFKKKFQDRIIKYDNSPSGKVYIGIAKTPLMKTETGIGFKGVVLQDENRQYVQCYECGKWMKKITNKHLEKCCGKTISNYKLDHGINISQGLVSDNTSRKLTKAALKNKDRGKNLKPIINKNKSLKRIQNNNMYGTCPLQLEYRLYEFICNNKEMPTRSNRGGSLYKAIYNRFGRFGEALKNYGLPKYTRTGTTYKYVFPDYTVYNFNLNRIEDRDILFNLMIQKCDKLRQHYDSFYKNLD